MVKPHSCENAIETLGARMTKWSDDLTPAAINQIVFEIRDGEADKDDARALLKFFCESQIGSIPNRVIEHLQYAFSEYLSGEKTLESALGLAKKKGRPKANEQQRIELAAEVLRCRLEGNSHQNCLKKVSKESGWGETIVGEAWTAHKPNALVLLRMERVLDEHPWTADEMKRITEIFKGEPWFGTSGNSPIKPA